MCNPKEAGKILLIVSVDSIFFNLEDDRQAEWERGELSKLGSMLKRAAESVLLLRVSKENSSGAV